MVYKPFALVEKKELNSIKDKDVIFNYEVILKFRDFLERKYGAMAEPDPFPDSDGSNIIPFKTKRNKTFH